jgi:chromate reductase, NAD(P)H dehydrogenase (quinone)
VQQRFESTIADFLDSVAAGRHYPCIKRAWVAYLGEQPQPAIDRVE